MILINKYHNNEIEALEYHERRDEVDCIPQMIRLDDDQHLVFHV